MAVTVKLPCLVDQIIDHGEHVYSLELVPQRVIPRFLPGQFLHLAIDAYDASGFWPDSRVFSIANAPAQRDRLRVTYSVVGSFTRRMEQELRAGAQVWVKLPYGEFFIQPNKEVVLLAGGTGVTAFTAHLESLPEQTDHPLTLFYGARKRELFIYRDVVELARRRCASIRAFYVIEEALAAEALALDELPGRISLEMVWARVAQPQAADFYLSGPPKMLADLSQGLQARGVLPGAIHIDAW